MSDEQLNAWAQNAIVEHETGGRVLEVTPYAVNRLILHGLTTSPNEWSTAYCDYLISVIEWISVKSEEDDLATKAFKNSYPPDLLSNLSLLVLIKKSPLTIEEKSEYLGQVDLSGQNLYNMFYADEDDDFIWFVSLYKDPVLKDIIRQSNFKFLIQNSNHIIQLLLSTGDQDQDERDQIFEVIQPYWDRMIIDDIQGLLTLFECTSNDDQRNRILSRVHPDVTIGNLGFLVNLLEYQINEGQRQCLLQIITPKLHQIKNIHVHELIRLLNLSSDTLHTEQRAAIIDAIAPAYSDDSIKELRCWILISLGRSFHLDVASDLEQRLVFLSHFSAHYPGPYLREPSFESALYKLLVTPEERDLFSLCIRPRGEAHQALVQHGFFSGTRAGRAIEPQPPDIKHRK